MPTPDHDVPHELLPQSHIGHEGYGWPVEAPGPSSWGAIKQHRKIDSGIDAALQH